jgi:hypothetical protein
MVSKATKAIKFLLPGLILTIAAIYAYPMQQALGCGGGCDGGGKKGGGSLVNVQDNNIGNNIGNINAEHNKLLSNNKVNVLSNDKILSNNHLKDINVLSKNSDNLKDINVLSKFTDNYFDVLSDNFAHSDILNGINTNVGNVGVDILNDYYKQMCGC